jgi:hypothetical protein
MNATNLDRALRRKGSDPDKLARSLARSPELVEVAVRGLHADAATPRFTSAKVLLALARKSPGTLRPWIGSILELLDSDNKFLKSAAIRTLGHLAPVDSTGRITRALAKILEPIPGPNLVVACNAIDGAARIARVKPRLKNRVVPAILAVERGRYRTRDCRNVAIGNAIDALDELPVGPAWKSTVEEFVLRQRRNSRRSTRTRAERFLRRREIVDG